jgi:hypothetical protein
MWKIEGFHRIGRGLPLFFWTIREKTRLKHIGREVNWRCCVMRAGYLWNGAHKKPILML